MLARIIENNIFYIMDSDQNRLEEIIISLKHIPDITKQNLYLKDVAINSSIFKDFEIIRPSENPDFDKNKNILYNSGTEQLWIIRKIHDDKYIKAEINTKSIKDNIFNNIEDEKNRRIYLVDKSGKLILAHNYDEEDFQKSKKQLPVNLVNNIATRFEEIKNQPRVYLKMNNVDLIIIVNTSEELTE